MLVVSVSRLSWWPPLPLPALVSSLLPLEHSGLSSRNNEEVATQHTSDVITLSPRGSYDTYDAFDGGLPKAKITKKGGSPNTYLDTLERNATFCRHLHHSLSTFSLIILLEYAIFCPNYLTVAWKQKVCPNVIAHINHAALRSIFTTECWPHQLQQRAFRQWFSVLPFYNYFTAAGRRQQQPCSTAVPVMQLQCCSLIWPWTCSRPRQVTQFHIQNTTHGNNVWQFESGVWVWESPKRIICMYSYIKYIIAKALSSTRKLSKCFS